MPRAAPRRLASRRFRAPPRPGQSSATQLKRKVIFVGRLPPGTPSSGRTWGRNPPGLVVAGRSTARPLPGHCPAPRRTGHGGLLQSAVPTACGGKCSRKGVSRTLLRDVGVGHPAGGVPASGCPQGGSPVAESETRRGGAIPLLKSNLLQDRSYRADRGVGLLALCRRALHCGPADALA